MSKFDYKKIMPRYSFIAILMTLLAAAVLAKTLYIMTAKRDFWMQVADRVKKDSVSVKPMRGNILSCDGQLMASSMPEFKLYMDFQQLCMMPRTTLCGMSNSTPSATD
jgi:cell division protein FtsI (penicillin-binding protein 3)